jgi:hypothetical protein
MVIRRINDPLAMRKISLIWRDTSPLDASLKILARVFREVAADILRSKKRGV